MYDLVLTQNGKVKMVRILKGQTLSFSGDPFIEGVDAASQFETDGAVAIEGGKIIQSGPAEGVISEYPGAEVTDYGRCLLSAGFVDAHAHFPQTAIIASWGKRLIDWLNSYTFPEEMRYGDEAYAREHLMVSGLDSDTFLSVFGQYVLSPKIFDYLDEHISLNIREKGEFQLTSCLDRLRQEEGFAGYVVQGRRFDIGVPEAYRQTMIDFRNG